MGRVRLLYKPPYSIHGTDDLESLGEKASHGSVRMANEEVIELAKKLMEIGGVDKPDKWYEEVLENREIMVEVSLPDPIPLTNMP